VYVPPTNNIPLPPPGDATVHTVVKNDSFYSLGKKYGVTMKAVELANPGVDSSKLKLGQKLNIPAKAAPPLAPAPGANNLVPPGPDAEGTYTVKAGDNLGKIAAANGTTVKAVMAANNLRTTAIKANQKLKLPAKTAPAPAPVPPIP
jgi:LysM repeat protein